MASKKKSKKESKKLKRDKRKGKKGSGKLPKKSPKVTKLKAPDKKKAAVEVPTGDIDLSTVMITEAFRRHVCRELQLSPRDTGYVTKVVNSVYRAVGMLQCDMIANGDNPLAAGRLREVPVIDLGTLEKVSEFRELQDEVRNNCQDPFIGPVAVSILQTFVWKAKQIVLARSSDASAG